MDKSMYDRMSAGNPRLRHSNINIHTIITELKKKTDPVSFSEIEKETGISVERTPGLLDLLGKNKKIRIEGKALRFVPTYVIEKEEDLLKILRKTESAYGIPLEEITDTNNETRPFIDSLIKKEEAILLKDLDGSFSIFYNPVKIAKPSKEIQKLYEEVSVPDPRDLAKELTTAGLITKTIEKPLRKAVTQKKKRYIRKIKITNTHLNNAELGM
ncbi:transcription initiation factor TFIIE subunit beta [Nematocida sp. LUAm3]|nr:transcription initiation factor TFIIE subunit beta [Nematocida sp. LUAm3]KAI5174537.1 transcription initiation factor TFIIE subunit beta [Nematocida sp. LUAm2]KAI5178057.1 transcription initiation factor TFIIE subunit beta [Nematocida sp. LUAm1]